MTQVTAEQVCELREKYGYGMAQAKRVATYSNLMTDIGKIESSGRSEDAEYIKDLMIRMLRFCAPDECTGADCSCHNQTEDIPMKKVTDN